MNKLSRETLEDTIQNLESLIKDHEKEYEKNPLMLGYHEGFYNHKECADDYKIILGYLNELQDYRQGDRK